MSNAEDFTKQFMGDMFGGKQQQQAMQQPIPQQQQQQFRSQAQQHFQSGGQLQVNQSENIDTSSNKPKKGKLGLCDQG